MLAAQRLMMAADTQPYARAEFLNWGSGGSGNGQSGGVDVSSWNIQANDTILIMSAVGYSYPVHAGFITFDTSAESGGTNRTSLFTHVTSYDGTDSGYYYDSAHDVYVYFGDDALPTSYVYLRTGQGDTAMTFHVAHFRNATSCTLVGNNSDGTDVTLTPAYTEATALNLGDFVLGLGSKVALRQNTISGPTNSDANITEARTSIGTGFDGRSVMSRKKIAGNHTFQFTGASISRDETSSSWSTTTVRLR